MTVVARAPMFQVLGAVAYGEKKAYEEASAKATLAGTDQERRVWRKTAAEELRHHKGFVRRLEALGADPERAMRPYRRALDRYHAATPRNDLEEAVWSYLGEGVADDLLRWLKRVADRETSAFVDTVLADEVGHEERATADLKRLLSEDPARRAQVAGAAWRMLAHMGLSGLAGGPSLVRFGAFLRVGSTRALLDQLVRGFSTRLRALGLGPRDLLSSALPITL